MAVKYISSLHRCVSGDAYVAYGNYSQAKKFYTEAVTLQYEIPQTARAICYNVILERMRYRVLGVPKSTVNRDSGTIAAAKLELSVYLHRLARISLVRSVPSVLEAFHRPCFLRRRNINVSVKFLAAARREDGGPSDFAELSRCIRKLRRFFGARQDLFNCCRNFSTPEKAKHGTVISKADAVGNRAENRLEVSRRCDYSGGGL